ncbi:MAG: hypothetical protein JO200_21220, partial [Comamonas sp.]|nr:hypothetical protein [Comamonas sp.]
MTLLNNPSWIGLDGTPVTGRTPPQLLVLEGRLTQVQLAAVQSLYQRFCADRAASAVPTFVREYTLSDGSRVRCESRFGIDRALVWPVSPERMPEDRQGIGYTVFVDVAYAPVYDRELVNLPTPPDKPPYPKEPKFEVPMPEQ